MKGFKALGNQLTSDKLKQVNLMESLPYEAPEEVVAEEIEVIESPEMDSIDDPPIEPDEDGQITLF